MTVSSMREGCLSVLMVLQSKKMKIGNMVLEGVKGMLVEFSDVADRAHLTEKMLWLHMTGTKEPKSAQ